MTVPLVFRPALLIEIAGQRIAGPHAQSLSAVLVRQALAAASVAELDFANPDAKTVEGMRHGEALKLFDAERKVIFAGEICGIEHVHDGSNGHTLRVRAYDRLQRLRTKRRVRAISKTSAAALAAELASEIECGSAVARTTPERELVIQQGESDLDLLADLAADAGAYPYLHDDTLHLIGLDGVGDPVSLALGRTLYSVRATLSNERALGRSETFAWTPRTNDRVRADTAQANQDAAELRNVNLRAQAAERLVLNAVVDGENEARALAQADMDWAAGHEAAVTGAAQGRAELRPGQVVQIEGVAADVAGRYVIAEALHRFDATSGYMTEFSTVPPKRPARQRNAVYSIGEVSDTNDPEGLGRCRVKLPAFSSVESGWMPVLISGAGKGKGLIALPETGDEVLVTFPNGDAAHGIILGGLFGRKRMPRGAARRRARPFVLRTGGGQCLELSAEGGLARLSTSIGSLLELTHATTRLASATDLIIEAPGRKITIRAAAVNFERG